MNVETNQKLIKFKQWAFPDWLDKAKARQQMRAQRRAQDSRLAAYRSSRITQRVLDLPEVKLAKTVAVYASTNEEVSTDSLAQALLTNGVKLVYPVTRDNKIELYPVESLDSLHVKGAYGIREPDGQPGEPVNINQADVILAPGVAFDIFGGRVGFGGGYYDRLLDQKRNNVVVIGLAFESQVVHAINTEPHDQPVDLVITDDAVYQPTLYESISNSEDETHQLAKSIITAGEHRVIALHGDLGAGKTCFVNGLAQALHTREAVASPTFVYCREYHGDQALIHADAYRLERVPEHETEYWAQLFESDAIVAVEWAERLGGLLPKTTLHCFSETASETTRRWTWFTAKRSKAE